MLWTQRLWLRLQTVFRSGPAAQRLDEELQFHLDQQIAENIAAGMSRDEARHAAMRLFGNPTVLKEEARAAWGWIWFDNFARDLRHSSRTLSRTPGFSVLTILVIALGIGATTALFTVVRSVLLEPLPFRDPSRLVRLYEQSADGKFPYNASAAGVFAEWKKQSTAFADLAILEAGFEYGLSGTGGQLPERMRASECSWDLFPTLGVTPALGRSFTAADDQSSANATVLLSWALWKRRFGGDPSILNQTIHLDTKLYTVIGVMPAWFTYPESSVQLWTPIQHEESPQRWQQLDNHMFRVVGRLKSGVTESAATQELSLITRRLHDAHLDNPFVSAAANSRPLLEDIVGDLKTPLYVLLAATGCLLLIACLNVASLLVARGSARRKELAIRAALGGSRWRLLSEHVTETLLLCAAGGGAGLAFAYAAVQWFVADRQDLSRVEAIHVDSVVVAFAVGLILLCALFAGIASSLSSAYEQVLSSLQESSRSHSVGQRQVNLRKWLLAMEVGLTVILLIGAGLMLKSYQRLRTTDLGSITNNVLTMHLYLPNAKYGQPVQRVGFFETLLGRVRSLPGVQFAGLTTTAPGEGYGGDHGFLIEGHPPLPQGTEQYAVHRWVDPGYFQALGIPFLRGQTFDDNQKLDQVNEVIISSSFARQYFGDEDPVGKRLMTLGQRPYKIVGVVGDTRYEIAKPAQPIFYFPFYSGTEFGGTLAVRSARDVTSLALPIQEVVRELDSELPVSDILTMDQMIGKSTVDASFNTTLLLAFAVLSLALAAVGLFGVLSYIVSQRTSEIGIRIAIGAQRSEVLRLMISDGLRPAGVGLLLGLAGGAVASENINDLLYGVRPLDASVFAGVAVLLLAVAVVACLLPAWRASRLDPMQALRNE
ncbi:MAG TPA: ABC transporter permease [Candidatus Methylomirabilis sp.]|nr:ABC transporter permease [Candidatus Methylomirabilis sp.]